MANPDTWYFSSDGENRLGPFPWTQIEEYLNDGRLPPETLLWAPHLPEWVPAERLSHSNPKTAKPLKAILIAVGFFVGILALGGIVHTVRTGRSSEDRLVRIVKDGHLTQYPKVTVGRAVDGFFGDPKWESGTADDGSSVVNVTGKIQFMDRDVNARVQFVVHSSDSTFEVYAFEMNGVPQNDLMKFGLLAKMFNR